MSATVHAQLALDETSATLPPAPTSTFSEVLSLLHASQQDKDKQKQKELREQKERELAREIQRGSRAGYDGSPSRCRSSLAQPASPTRGGSLAAPPSPSFPAAPAVESRTSSLSSISLAPSPAVTLDASTRSLVREPRVSVVPVGVPSLEEILGGGTAATVSPSCRSLAADASSRSLGSSAADPLAPGSVSQLLADLHEHLSYTRDPERSQPQAAGRRAARPTSAGSRHSSQTANSSPLPGEIVRPGDLRSSRPGSARSVRSNSASSVRSTSRGAKRGGTTSREKTLNSLYGSPSGSRGTKPHSGTRSAWDSSSQSAASSPIADRSGGSQVATFETRLDTSAAVQLAKSKLGASCIAATAGSGEGAASGADALAHLLGSAPAATTGGAGELAAILGGDMRAPTADVRPSLLDKLVAAAQPLSPAGTETSASVTHLSVSTAASTPTRRSYKSSTTAARLTEIEQALRNGVADHTPAYEKGQTVLTKVFRAFDPDGCGHISSGAFRKLLGVFEIEASESEARAIVASSPRPSNPPVERALYYDKYISHLFVRFKPRRRSDDSSASLGGSALSATGGGSRAAVAASAHTAPPRASSGNPSAPLRHEETQVKEAIASARVGAANSGAGALCGTADEAAAVFLDEVVALHTSAARDHGGVGATLVAPTAAPASALEVLLTGGELKDARAAPAPASALEALLGGEPKSAQTALTPAPAPVANRAIDALLRAADKNVGPNDQHAPPARLAAAVTRKLEAQTIHSWQYFAWVELRDYLEWLSTSAAAATSRRADGPPPAPASASALTALLASKEGSGTAEAERNRVTKETLLDAARAAIMTSRAAFSALEWKGAIELHTTSSVEASRAHSRNLDAARKLWQADANLPYTGWREFEARYASPTASNSAQVASLLLTLRRAVDRAGAARAAIRQRLKLLAHARSLVDKLTPPTEAATGAKQAWANGLDSRLRDSLVAQLRSLIGLLRQAGVHVVETIVEWRALYRQPLPFEWEGANYLIAMQTQHVALPRALVDEIQRLGGRPPSTDAARQEAARLVIEREAAVQATRAMQDDANWVPPALSVGTRSVPMLPMLRWLPVDELAMRSHLGGGTAHLSNNTHYYEPVAESA